MMDCTSDATSVAARQLLRNQYCRANVPMAKEIGLDDWENVAELEQYTLSYMKTNAWQSVRSWVKEYWDL